MTIVKILIFKIILLWIMTKSTMAIYISRANRILNLKEIEELLWLDKSFKSTNVD